MEEDVRAALLNRYYSEVHAVMLAHQSHTLGLFPRGQSKHARVRDNVYCATALWCFSMAYRHVGDDKGRTHELEQSAVKCMRGLLYCYMRQADKVERFKHRQSWEDALHARFDCHTGDHVTEDESWGHLQIDGTSLFLLMLAQMTASGVQIIFTMDEVDFIQNLVFYVERAYRIPDYGMWERGSRDNQGRRELHASSIGMAKAALEAINGLNLFGSQGSSLSIIHVDPDAQYRNCIILDNLLPRESSSKETDASLLCITGYPAFAIDHPGLCMKTEDRAKEILEGNRGFKRFLRDGHHTVREDPSKKYYDSTELIQYEGIECEWPLFYLICVLTEMCRGHNDQVEKYLAKFEKCVEEIDGHLVVPRLYFVPDSEITEDSGTQGSVVTLRDCNDYRLEPMSEEVPFQWAQALHFICRMAREGLIMMSDLDPLGLHLPHQSRHRGMARHLGFKAPGHDTIVQVAIITESTRLQAILATHGIPTQTQKQVEPIKIRPPNDILMKVLNRIGENRKLGLSGRPSRPIGTLGTSKVYRIFGQTVIFYPTDTMSDFYTCYDSVLLIDILKNMLKFLNLYWNMSERPTLCLYLTEKQVKGSNFKLFVKFLAGLKQGEVGAVKVRLDKLQSLIPTSCIEHLECGQNDDLDLALQHRLFTPLPSRSSAAHLSVSSDDFSVFGTDDTFTVDEIEIQQLEGAEGEVEEVEPSYSPTDVREFTVQQLRTHLKNETNQLGELYLLHELIKKNEKQYDINYSIEDRLEGIYEQAGEKKHWKTVRLAAAMTHKVVDSLAPSVTSMLVRGKEVCVGVFNYPEGVISEPLTPKAIVSMVYEKCMPHNPIEVVMQQEIIIYLGAIMSSSHDSSGLHGMLRLRIGWIIEAMKNELKRTSGGTESLYQVAPHDVKELLIQVLADDDTRNPLQQRQLNGALNRVPKDFYVKIFSILEKMAGGIHVRGRTLPQMPTIHELVAHEKNFAIRVEELLSNITFPEYRQVIIELLMVVSTVVERNPELGDFRGVLNLDDLLQDSMAIFNLDKSDRSKLHPHEQTDGTDRGADDELSTSYVCHRMGSFYTLPPDGQYGSASYITRAVVNRMLHEGLRYDSTKNCTIS